LEATLRYKPRLGSREIHTKCAQQRSVCTDQILTEFGEHPCGQQQARILAPTPLTSANAKSAAHDAMSSAERTQRDLKVAI